LVVPAKLRIKMREKSENWKIGTSCDFKKVNKKRKKEEAEH